MINREEIINKIADTLVGAGSTFSNDKIERYIECINNEDGDLSKWAMEQVLENAYVARDNKSPLCDDTGIPHIVIEIGKNRVLSGEMIDAIYEGVKLGLRTLPGRPMAINGKGVERISQEKGINSESDAVLPAPLSLKYIDEDDKLKVNILMQGGGPEIRAKTYRIFHKHSKKVVLDEIISWAKDVVGDLGCSPCTLAIGIGRSHYEASSLMLQAMIEGNYSIQSEEEKYITAEVNKTKVGALGLGGKFSVIGTFLKVGPQRASGVRIVCLRPCCCFEPRKYSVEL